MSYLGCKVSSSHYNYDTLKHRPENAHSAVEAAIEAKRRVVRLNEAR
jgi:hypothetical protein